MHPNNKNQHKSNTNRSKSKRQEQKNSSHLESSVSSKVSDSKTIKESAKISQIKSINNPQRIVTGQFYRQTQSELKEKFDQEDKKTEHQRQNGSRMRTKNLEQELEKQQQHARQGVIRSNRPHDPTNEEKSNVKSRFRKLLVQHQVLNKMKDVSNVDASLIRRQEQEYGQIANEIQLNTLHSKAIMSQSPNDNSHIVNKLKQSESFIIPSPARGTEQKLVDTKNRNNPQIQGPQISVFYSLENIVEIQTPKEYHQQNLEFQKQQPQQELSEKNQSQEKGVQVLQDYKDNNIEDSIALTVSKAPFCPSTKNREAKLEFDSSVLSQKMLLTQKVKQGKDQQRLEQQILSLRNVVRELRLQKIKQKAQKERSQQSQLSSHSSAFKSGRGHSTIIGSLNFEQQSQEHHRTEKVKKQPSVPVSFGRIRKNRSSQKPSLSFQKSYNPVNQPHALINISKLKTNNQDRVVLSSRDRQRQNFNYNSQQFPQYKTMSLQHISQETVQEANTIASPITNSLSLSKPAGQGPRGSYICEKIMNKIDSYDKRIHKFLVREQSKAKNKGKRYSEQKALKGSAEEISSNKSVQKPFEGSIVKNINKSFNETDKITHIRSSVQQLISSQVMNLIQQAEKTSIKQEIKFSGTQIPSFPDNPKPKDFTQKMMQLIMLVLSQSDERVKEEDLKGCSLKKYKNCIMFQLPQNETFKLIWHYSGKLYFGEWNPELNQKQGQGQQYMKKKYYYKGAFKGGKKYGKGLLIESKGNIYEGELINGIRQGKGKHYDKVEESRYEGQWKNDKRHGNGYLQLEGNVYKGSFKDNLKEGFGIQYFSNGDTYYGEYVQNKFQGQGKYVWADSSFYIGTFHGGMRHGQGKWVSSSSQAPQIYIGSYYKDKKQGEGKYIWQNGCIYEGSFQNDYKHGIGSVQYPDGTYMEGMWNSGILNEVLSKLSQAHRENPIDQPKRRSCEMTTHLKVREIDEIDK